MNVEMVSALEAARLLTRNPIKYIRGVSGMYLLSIKGFELGQLARACFFFFRNIDDALDGDRKDIKNPLRYVLNCRKQISSGKYRENTQIINLAKFAIERLQKKSKKGDHPKQNFLDEIDIILFDHQRIKKRKILTTKEIKNYYKKTFFPVINLMLIGLNSKLRANNIPQLSFCQGRIYTVRDLDTDWARGVINIPKEVLKRAKLTTNSTVERVKSNPIIIGWFRKELLQCQKDLPILEAKLQSTNESLTTRMCMGLINPLYKLSKQYLNFCTAYGI